MLTCSVGYGLPRAAADSRVCRSAMHTHPKPTPPTADALRIASDMVGPSYDPPDDARPTRLIAVWPCAPLAVSSQSSKLASATHLYTRHSRPDDRDRRAAWALLSMTLR